VTPAPPLFRLADLTDEKTVYLVQREVGAEALWARQMPATFVALGRWRPDYVTQLQTAGVRTLVVLPERSPAGATQGRQIADACARAGLAVKLVPTGDLRDYFATHTKAALLQVVREAPLHDPHRPVTQPPPLVLTSVGDLLDTPDEAIAYVVEGRIPTGSVCLVCAPPKTGKGTLTRTLALAVGRGIPWLGWRTTQGRVWVFTFEDQAREVKQHLRQMGASHADPVQFFTQTVPEHFLRDLRAQLLALPEADRPLMVVIDHLGHILRAKDFNDYAQVTAAFAPILAVARDSGVTLVLNFHASTHEEREGLHAVMGSTAIPGSVDNVFLMKRQDTQRVLTSTQRIGDDLPATIIELNKTTGWFETLGTKQQRDDHALGDRLRDALRDAGAPLGEATLHSQVEGRKQDKVRVLRKLLGMGWVVRLGSGGRHHPYTYTVPELVPEGSHLFPEVPAGTRGPREESGNLQEPDEIAGGSTYVRTSVRTEELRSSAATPLFNPKGWKE
jgi:hypothetical protein